MEDKTTTDASVSDGGSEAINGVAVDANGSAIPGSQPTTTETAEAVTDTTDSTQEAQETEEPAKADNSSVEWLKKKGIDPNSPEAIEKVAEMARNAEKAMHEKAQKASELEKSVQVSQDELPYDAPDNVLNANRVRNIELKQQLQDWRLANPDKREQEKAMTDLLVSDPNLRAMVREGYLDFDKLHAMAKGLNTDIVGDAKSQGKREALETLAQKQQAAVPTGSAVSPSGTGAESITPQNVDRLVATHDVEWFKAHHDEINRAMAG